jgi:hypothetical protein
MTKRKAHLVFATIILYSSVFLVSYLISVKASSYPDKSDGLIERVLGLCIFSSIFFYIIKRKLIFLGIGLLIGLISYISLFLFYIIESVLNPGNMLFPSMRGDQLIAATIVFLIGLFYYDRDKKITIRQKML